MASYVEHQIPFLTWPMFGRVIVTRMILTISHITLIIWRIVLIDHSQEQTLAPYIDSIEN